MFPFGDKSDIQRRMQVFCDAHNSPVTHILRIVRTCAGFPIVADQVMRRRNYWPDAVLCQAIHGYNVAYYLSSRAVVA
jgi:hypothetical protein